MTGSKRLRASLTGALVIGMTVAGTAGVDAATGTWTTTGSMLAGREDHTATLLPNGEVLVAGGTFDRDDPTAELYDPATGTWRATAEGLPWRLFGHTATLLPDGRVLVVGGSGPSGPLSWAFVYDPEADTWTSTGSMTADRSNHTATLLDHGEVLVTGGIYRDGADTRPLRSAELYDPAKGTWRSTASMAVARTDHSATLLPNGKVLVAGGSTPSTSTELYDPPTERWTATGSMKEERHGHDAVLLSGRRVMVVGGWDVPGEGSALSTEVYDVSSGTWSPGAFLLRDTSSGAAVVLPDGRVVAAGEEAAVFDSGVWTRVAGAPARRSHLEAVVLQDGRVLTMGGTGATTRRGDAADLLEVSPDDDAAISVTRTGSGRGRVTSTPEGIRCGKSCSAEFLHGTDVELKADPARRSRFAGWRGCPEATGDVCTLSLGSDTYVKARFKRQR